MLILLNFQMFSAVMFIWGQAH